MSNFYFGRVVQTALYITIWTFWRKIVHFPKKYDFQNQFRTLTEKFSTFCWKYLAGCQNFILRVDGNFLRKHHYLRKKYIFVFIFFGSWAKNFRPLVENFSAGCPHCILRHHINIMRKEITFFRKKRMLNSFPDIEGKVVDFLRNKLRWGVKTAFYVSIEFFRGKMVMRKKIMLSQHFRIMSRKLSAICREIIGGVVKTAFYVSMWTFWETVLLEIFIYSDIGWRTFGLLSKLYAGCHTWYLAVPRKLLEIFFLNWF